MWGKIKKMKNTQLLAEWGKVEKVAVGAIYDNIHTYEEYFQGVYTEMVIRNLVYKF